MDISDYSTELIEREGIFFAKKDSQISYPEKGNDNFFQIEDNSFWFIHRNNCIIESVKKYSHRSVFFDIGGGNGYISKGLENHQIETVLVEPGFGGCLNAKKRNIKTIVCSTLENASFKKNTIEAIGLFDVVEHIEKDNEFLASIHSFLKEDGHVYITVPAFNFLWSNEDTDAGHYRRYTLKSLEEKLIDKGFTIVQSTYIFSILPVAVFLFRTLPSKLGMNKNSDNINKHEEEHSQKKGVFRVIMSKIWEWELRKIKAGKKICVGGSCFVVAKKIKKVS